MDTNLDFAISTSASNGDDVDSTNLLNPPWSLDTNSETDICSDEEGPWLDDEETDHPLPKRQIMKKASDPDPRSFVATVCSMLTFMKSQRSNYLQMMMGKKNFSIFKQMFSMKKVIICSFLTVGLHLRGMSCPKQLINLLNTMGLSMCYTTSTGALKALAGDQFRLLRKVARFR